MVGWMKTFTGASVIAFGGLTLDLAITHLHIGRPTVDRPLVELVHCFQRGDFDLVSIRHAVIGEAGQA
jgi:hypothetical protein